MIYNPYLDVGLQITHGVSPYFYAEVPEPCAMTTAAEVAANDEWLTFRARRMNELFPDMLTLHKSGVDVRDKLRAVEAQIVREWTMFKRILMTDVTCPCCEGSIRFPEWPYDCRCDVCGGNLKVWFIVALWWYYDVREFEEVTND